MSNKPYRLAVLGNPVSHSLSPYIHRLTYYTLGLFSWSYERIECNFQDLPIVIKSMNPEWLGLSITRPGKAIALKCASQCTSRSRLVGSANTLVRLPSGEWHADNTDIDGIIGSLKTKKDSALIIGSGSTALASIVALAKTGTKQINILSRNQKKTLILMNLAKKFGIKCKQFSIQEPHFINIATSVEVAINTVPANIRLPYLNIFASIPKLIDVTYTPCPTPLAKAVKLAGGEVISGLHVLLYQSFSQIEQFIGKPVPKKIIHSALLDINTNISIRSACI